MPKIRLMSYWENAADHAVFVRNANAIKRIWLRHGADDFRIARVHTGQNTGQYEVTIANGKLTERVITVEIELD
jgi:hypothetical protein